MLSLPAIKSRKNVEEKQKKKKKESRQARKKGSKESRGRGWGGGRASEAKAAGGNDFAFMAMQEAAGGEQSERHKNL